MQMMNGHIWGWIFMMIFWVLVIAVLIYGVRWLAGRNRPGEGDGGGKAPIEILKERYARGEITLEEFEQMKKDLE